MILFRNNKAVYCFLAHLKFLEHNLLYKHALDYFGWKYKAKLNLYEIFY
uniref:Uncharacterized protein n=1 Tax=Rhizophora mucronata TaxID=61149 RepID=A0A2P2ITX6_RHIMU